MQTLYARGGGGGSQEKEIADGADGADVVFTDTALKVWYLLVLYAPHWHSAAKCMPTYQ